MHPHSPTDTPLARGSGRPAGGLPVAPVSQDSPVVAAAQSLLELLSSGKYRPGDRLPSVEELRIALNVGKSAVREALGWFQIQGFVTTHQGSGTYLNTEVRLLPRTLDWGLMLSRPPIHDLVEARHCFEMDCAKLAAQRITPDGTRRLADRLAAMRDAQDNNERFVEADVAFHLEVAAIADNSVMSIILDSIRTLLYVWITRAARTPEQIASTLAEHQRVYNAIAAGDPQAARDAMGKHMEDAGARLTESLSQL